METKISLNTPYPCAFERNQNGAFQPIEDWNPGEIEEEQNMDILQQCQNWYENDEHQKIVDALEAIPAQERTADMDMELARAYNNLADPGEPDGISMLRQAVQLMQAHEDEWGETYFWNFRMGYAYFYLDQEGRALRHFKKALELHPGDDPKLNTRQDIEKFIGDCERLVSLPYFDECFRERTAKAWEAFVRQEAELRRIMDEDKNNERGDELIKQCENILNLAFDDISLGIGFNGEKYELILTPEGNKVKLFQLVYFQKHAPDEALEHWNILVGRRRVENIELRTDEWELCGDDVQVWVDELGENNFGLSVYCEKLMPMLRDEEGRGWWMLTTLTDQVIGEIPNMRYISSFDVLQTPKAEPSILIRELPDKLMEMGLDLSADPESYLESYLAYQMQPNENPDADWRLDVIGGSTCCPSLINDYLQNDEDAMDDLHSDGAVAGFFCYPLDGFTGDERSRKIFDFRDKLEQKLAGAAGADALTLIGGATGIYCGYVDFIAWDLTCALNMAKELFDDSDIAWANFHVFRRDASTVSLKKPEDEASETGQTQNEQEPEPEVYSEEELEAVEGHIQRYFGTFENVFHELVSTDIHVDICMVPPAEGRNYYTLVTMGMGAHLMNVPEELAQYKLERAELAIALPSDWKVEYEAFKDERWYWPIRLLKCLARFPGECDTWLGWGHTVDSRECFADNTRLCASILIDPLNTEEGSEVCTLPNGDTVNFYQVLPLYRDELEYKLEHNADALMEKMSGISFVVRTDRRDVITGEAVRDENDDDGVIVEMDDAAYHLKTLREKKLAVDEINVYNHMAIYLRWCIEHELMGDEFLAEYGEVVQQLRTDHSSVDLRSFIRDELDGNLFSSMFNKKGRAFAAYYYGENDSPYFPGDIDTYAVGIIGQERNYSDEIQDEAYLFICFDEDYYQAMAKVIEKRLMNWQGQSFDEDTLEPSELAQAMMDYLDCECTYFPSMRDDDPIVSSYSYAKRVCAHEGFVPVLVRADETLWECLMMNSDPDSGGADGYAFDYEKVADYRKKMLGMPVKDGKTVLGAFIDQRKSEAADDDLDWENEVLGEMDGSKTESEPNLRFATYWNFDTQMTFPLILAKIPVSNPWEIFAYLPFGDWNDCPDTPELMAAAKYWFEQYGAVPAAMTNDELEFELTTPIPREKAIEAAMEQYGLCPDVYHGEERNIGALADMLRQSTVWYFWWD